MFEPGGFFNPIWTRNINDDDDDDPRSWGQGTLWIFFAVFYYGFILDERGSSLSDFWRWSIFFIVLIIGSLIIFTLSYKTCNIIVLGCISLLLGTCIITNVDWKTTFSDSTGILIFLTLSIVLFFVWNWAKPKL